MIPSCVWNALQELAVPVADPAVSVAAVVPVQARQVFRCVLRLCIDFEELPSPVMSSTYRLAGAQQARDHRVLRHEPRAYLLHFSLSLRILLSDTDSLVPWYLFLQDAGLGIAKPGDAAVFTYSKRDTGKRTTAIREK